VKELALRMASKVKGIGQWFIATASVGCTTIGRLWTALRGQNQCSTELEAQKILRKEKAAEARACRRKAPWKRNNKRRGEKSSGCRREASMPKSKEEKIICLADSFIFEIVTRKALCSRLLSATRKEIGETVATKVLYPVDQ